MAHWKEIGMMIALVIGVVLVVIAIGGTVSLWLRDGYGPVATRAHDDTGRPGVRNLASRG